MNHIESSGWRVVVNHEEQYSLWPAGKENAIGWRDAGLVGTKEQCLAYIREVWTDMRPLSLRKLSVRNDGAVMQSRQWTMNQQPHRGQAAAL